MNDLRAELEALAATVDVDALLPLDAVHAHRRRRRVVGMAVVSVALGAFSLASGVIHDSGAGTKVHVTSPGVAPDPQRARLETALQQQAGVAGSELEGMTSLQVKRTTWGIFVADATGPSAPRGSPQPPDDVPIYVVYAQGAFHVGEADVTGGRPSSAYQIRVYAASSLQLIYRFASGSVGPTTADYFAGIKDEGG